MLPAMSGAIPSEGLVFFNLLRSQKIAHGKMILQVRFAKARLRGTNLSRHSLQA